MYRSAGGQCSRRPRRRRGGGAGGELVLRRRRDRWLLRHLPAAGQSVGPDPRRSRSNTSVTSGGAVSRTYTVPARAVQRLGRRRAGHGRRLASEPASRRRCRSSPSARCTWAGGFFGYYEGHVQRARRRRARTGSSRRARSSAPTMAADVRADRQHGVDARDGAGSTLPETGRRGVERAPPIPGNARLTMPMSALPGFCGGGIEVVEEGSRPTRSSWKARSTGTPAGQPFGAGANWPATRNP